MRAPAVAFALAAAAALSAAPRAATLDVTVRDAAGAPVEDAVVVALAPSGSPKPKMERGPEIIDQIDKEFVPSVKVVQAGTPVIFPNKDNIRHHVYSFSPAKQFELPLYKGMPAQPVVFDKPGVVILGCNIHDWMIGYLYVVDSPWFAKTAKDGVARIPGLPAGEYDVLAFHPRSKDPAEAQHARAAVGAAETASASFQMSLKPPVRGTRPPRDGAAAYP